MKLKAAQALAAWALLLGLAATLNPASAQGQVHQTAAERCFEHHQFGAQPVDVAKTADGDTVLAQVSWGYHDSIGCYLTLDDGALAVMRAAPPPQSLPDARTTTSLRCFAHHRFGAQPVDVAKSADRQTVLARLSWGYHDSIGCYLVLDDSALSTLRAAYNDTETDTEATDTDLPPAGPQITPIAAGSSHSCAIRTNQTIGCWGDNGNGEIDAPPGSFTSIAVSSSHSCAIRADQTVSCWGYNRFGQTDAPPGQYTAIATHYPYSCGIRTDQTITCWGDNGDGQTDAPPGQYTAIAAGSSHSCAIKTDQTITCWGDNRRGLTNIPPGQFTAIAAGSSHSCAIRADQTVSCWGYNRDGQTDAPPGQFFAIAAGSSHSCAIKTDQTITCWGDNQYGQANAPPGQYTAIATGNYHSCAIKTNQAIACWGENQYGQTSVPIRLRTPQEEELLSVSVFSESEPEVTAGRSFEVAVEFNRAVNGFDADDINVVNGDVIRFSGSGSTYEATVTASALGTVVVMIPRATALDQDGRANEPSQPFARTVRKMTATATAIANGGYHSCEIRADQTTTCWGYNTYGQADAPPGQYTAIAAGETHTCAIKTDQTTTCWGYNRSGQADTPDGQFTAIAAGTAHSCAIKTDQTIACWGHRGTGLASVPVGHFASIAAGYTHTCAIKTNQTIACWGSNQHGQANAPPGQYTAIAAGSSHSCAIKTNQTTTCWGSNNDWQGNPVGQADAPPGQYTAIAAGSSHSCAIKADQTITCWGDNQYGQANAPPGQYTVIATGSYHSCAIKTNQAIACWGFNRTGQIEVPPSQFTVITPSGYSFGSHSCGITADQTIDCWTRDGNGRPDASPGQFAAVTPDDEFFDTWDRKAVRTSAFTEFHRQEPDHGWTGDIESCDAGTTSQEYRDSIFQRINWYRQMAGVDPVVENPEYSTLAQHAALIMTAHGWLSHFPPDDWACWTQFGYQGASNSNLSSRAGISSIHDGYMRDSGPNNIAVGHRRSILNPYAVEFSTGDIPPKGSNALYVVPESRDGLKNRTREEREFVAWPPPGYVPPAVNWGRWSFDLSDAHYPADFSTASVEVSDEFGPVEVEIIYRHSSGIVWAMDGDTNSDLLSGRRPLYSLADSNYCYTVTISGVKINDLVQTPYEYAVCILTR